MNNCIYCDKDLKGQLSHLDHFLPWLHLPINKFWNLYPSCQSCNSKKRDSIPLVSEELAAKIKQHLKACVKIQNTKKGVLILKDTIQLYHSSFNTMELTHDLSQMTEEIFDYLLSLRNELLSVVPGEQFITSHSKSEVEDEISTPILTNER